MKGIRPFFTMIPGPRRMTTYEWTWTTGGGKSKAALLAKSEKWGTPAI
jgi:hypothetical protein